MALPVIVNGSTMTIDVDLTTPLLWVLRENLGLTGTKFGCGIAQCGACTVLLDGQPIRSCVTPVARATGKHVTTIEGLSKNADHPVQRAWLAEQVAQCGYCQSGQIMATVALLKASPHPTDAEIDDALAGNLCRCGTYKRIRRAVHRAATLTLVALAVAAPSAQSDNRSVQAFSTIASVLSSARCSNCHISGDVPLQGEDARLHTMNVRRGADGRGAVGMRCTNCHQEASLDIPHAPPGAPDWRLPPPTKRMAWSGLSPGDQCRLLKDPATNGNRTPADVLDHAMNDPLVVACWHPGAGRTPPPVSHAAFVASVRTWIEGGAACPQ